MTQPEPDPKKIFTDPQHYSRHWPWPELSSNGELLGGPQLHPAVGELLPGGGRRMAKGWGGEGRWVVAAAAAVVEGVVATTAVAVVERAAVAVAPAHDIPNQGAVRRVASTEELRNRIYNLP